MPEFHIPTISCQHCVKAVTQALLAIDPQAQVQVNLAARTVQVVSSMAPALLQRALADAGYPVAAA